VYTTAKNTIEFTVWGRYALFTDPLTRLGGEKCSYHLPTYEALKGIAKSIYWKPTFIWYIDQVRIMRAIRTQSKSIKTMNYKIPGNDLSIYTYLTGDPSLERDAPGVEYQVRAHFEWNLHRPELAADRNDGKHFQIAQRLLNRGGNKDVFLGTRECQGYVEPCVFGEGKGAYDNEPENQYDIMFHSFCYPDETGSGVLETQFWRPRMINGVVTFPRPDEINDLRRIIRPMSVKTFTPATNFSLAESVSENVGATE
jgi:CRISPR-associated protein Cas5d